MTRDRFASKMATDVALVEFNAARTLGYSYEAAYAKSYRVGDETYGAVMSEDRPLITMGLRMIGNFR
jgi:hypothetical protein